MFSSRMTIWRYIGVCALIVYSCSFGIFMSRLASLSQKEIQRSLSVGYEDFTRDLLPATPREAREASTMSRRTTKFPESSLSPYLHFSEMEKSKVGKETLVPFNASKSVGPSGDEFRPEMKNLSSSNSQLSSLKKHHLSTGQGPFAGSSNTSASILLNPHPFNYVINCEGLCQDVDDLYLLVYVHTAPDHYKRRVVIRQTWGDGRQYDLKVRVVFFMGKPSSRAIQNSVQFEAEQYGDIVQENFFDTYRNLTYKGVAALKWISNFCPKARFILKTDDDIFVNMFTLLKHLRRLEQRSHDGKVSHLLLCMVWKGMQVMRVGKWMVSKEEWKDDTYPTYCSGCAFIMSTDVAVALHNISYSVPFFWVDDFYITGLLPLKLGTITHTQFMSTYLLNGNALEEKFTGSQWYQYIFSHVHNLDAIQFVWRKVVALSKGEFVPTVRFFIPSETPPFSSKAVHVR